MAASKHDGENISRYLVTENGLVHPKISMLNEYLLSPDGVSLDVLPPNEIGFLEYLDDNADNPVARVLAL